MDFVLDQPLHQARENLPQIGERTASALRQGGAPVKFALVEVRAKPVFSHKALTAG